MKKVSPTMKKQSRKFSPQKLIIVLDFGDCSSSYCVIDEAGQVLLERKVATTARALEKAFGSMPRCRIELETGMHSPWVSRVLAWLRHEVIVTRARNVRL